MSDKTPVASADGTTGQPELKRVMGPGLLRLFIVGDILGTGIYALTGTIAKEVGGAVWLPQIGRSLDSGQQEATAAQLRRPLT